MNFKSLEKLSSADREKKLAELEMDLLKLQGQVATGTTPKSPGEIKELKKTRARLQTMKRQGEKVSQ